MSILTEELVLKALAADVGDATLISWKALKGSKFGDNFFNDTSRIEVTFRQNGGEERKGHYFAKLNPRKENDMFNPYRNNAMRKEIFFYFELLPLLNKELASINKEPLKVPKCLTSCLEAEKEVIILKDLSIRGFVTYDRQYPMDDYHTTLMIEEVAKLHTASILLQKKYGDVPLTDVFPLLVETWNEPNYEYSEGFEKIYVKSMMRNANLARNIPEFTNLVPWLENLSRRPMDTLKSFLKSSNQFMEICHGDFHRTNVLFRYENNKPVDIMVLDWQTIRLAPIGSELGYVLQSSYTLEQKAHYEPMINSSVHKLMSEMLPNQMPYTFDELDIHTKSNYFGFLIAFYLIPLSVCVKVPAEMFLVTDEELKPDPEGQRKAKELMDEYEALRVLITELFQHIVDRKINKHF